MDTSAQPLSFLCDFGDMDKFDARAIKAAGIAGVILKASEGHTLKAHKFADRLKASRDEDLLLGAYHFGHEHYVRQQVDLFLGQIHDACNAAGIDPGDVRRMLDDEPDSVTDPQFTADECPQFLSLVSLPGKPALHYCGLSKGCAKWATASDATVAAMSAYPLVIAAYGPDPRTFPASHLPRPWRTVGWSLFQENDGGAGPSDHVTFQRQVPGIGGCDHSVFRGDAAALRAWWKGTAPTV